MTALLPHVKHHYHTVITSMNSLYSSKLHDQNENGSKLLTNFSITGRKDQMLKRELSVRVVFLNALCSLHDRYFNWDSTFKNIKSLIFHDLHLFKIIECLF